MYVNNPFKEKYTFEADIYTPLLSQEMQMAGTSSPGALQLNVLMMLPSWRRVNVLKQPTEGHKCDFNFFKIRYAMQSCLKPKYDQVEVFMYCITQ